MSEDLVQRWFNAAKPFSVGDIKKKYSAAYASALGLDEETKRRMQVAIDAFDENKVFEMLRAFAEENFSDDVLRAAVEFFESNLGQRYLDERQKVYEAGQMLIGRYIAENAKRAGLDG